MLTIDSELEKSLQAIAHQEHRSLNETIQILLNHYLNQHPEKTRFVKKGYLVRHPNRFTTVSRRRVMPAAEQSITQSLTGILANANVDEADYRQHLLSKHL